jgi:hypothetical protein
MLAEAIANEIAKNNSILEFCAREFVPTGIWQRLTGFALHEQPPTSGPLQT